MIVRWSLSLGSKDWTCSNKAFLFLGFLFFLYSFNIFSTKEKEALSSTALFSASREGGEGEGNLSGGYYWSLRWGGRGYIHGAVAVTGGCVGGSEGGGMRSCQLVLAVFFL